MSAPTPRPSPSPELRRHFLQLVLGVVAVHALFIGAYYAAGIEQRPRNVRNAYTIVWTAATLAVVLVGMTRIRAARLRARHARRGR